MSGQLKCGLLILTEKIQILWMDGRTYGRTDLLAFWGTSSEGLIISLLSDGWKQINVVNKTIYCLNLTTWWPQKQEFGQWTIDPLSHYLFVWGKEHLSTWSQSYCHSVSLCRCALSKRNENNFHHLLVTYILHKYHWLYINVSLFSIVASVSVVSALSLPTHPA